MIQRRKWITRSTKQLKRTPLRKVSVKHAKGLRLYSKLRKQFLEAHENCEIGRDGCTHQATEVHHVKKRGIYLNDPKHFLASCNSCHRWLHDNASFARTLGFLQ